MIRYFGVGKSRLPAGAQLRVLVLSETVTTNAQRESPKFAISFEGREVETPLLPLSEFRPIASDPGVAIHAYGVEVPTGGLTPGSSDLCLLAADEVVACLEENIWIVNSSAYRSLWGEEFAIDPSQMKSMLRIGDHPSLPIESLRRIIESAFSAHLLDCLIVKGSIARQVKVDIHFEEAVDATGDPLAYIANVFAEQCRDLLFFGTEDMSISVTFSRHACRFDLDAILSHRLSREMEAHYQSRESDMRMLKSHLEGLIPHATVQSDLNVAGRGLELSLSMTEDLGLVVGAS